MSIDIGIIGLPGSGRTTLFNALTRGQADTRPYSHATGKESVHVGIARVPEPRLTKLAELLQPKKVVPATARCIDITASVRDLALGTGGPLLNQLAAVDALINIVRSFRDDSVPHIAGSVDVDRDIADMNLELTFSDLALLERRLRRIEDSLKGAKAAERTTLNREQEITVRIKTSLEHDIPVREISLSAEEAKVISSFQLLSAKPLLVVLNIGEDQTAKSALIQGNMASQYSRSKCMVIALCAKLEAELAQLPDDDAQALRSEYGLTESALDRVITGSYELLGLITFFTIASGEFRAWPIPAGTEAIKAAGKIHSDMERGFIRAEVVSYSDLLKCGGISEARRKGMLRQEGHGYVVQDGDVITFLFNV